jgi:hypothetical protein
MTTIGCPAAVVIVCGLPLWRRDVPKRPTQEETLAKLVQSIINQLKPFRQGLEQDHVLAEINSTIERLKNPNLSEFLSRLVGSRRMNKERAKKLRATLKDLTEQLADAGLTFCIIISPTNQVGLWTPKQRIGELHGSFLELLRAKDSRLGTLELAAAFAARLLMEKLSIKKPTIPSEGKSRFLIIASLLFEAVSGERWRNLIRACRYVYHLRSERI